MHFHYGDCTRSGIFLRAIQFSDFADTVTTLQSHVNLFMEPFDDDYLPPHLRIHGLATSIHQNTQARMRDVFSPRVCHLHGSSPGLVQGVPTVLRIKRDNCNRINFHSRGGGEGIGRDYHDRGCGDNSRAPQERPHPQRGQGRLARPDRNRRPFLLDVRCAACKKGGHVAKQCDMLATDICLEQYIKNDLSALVWDAIEKDWLAKWRERLGNLDGTPRQVMHPYVEDLNIMVA
jgi:hypothetical protein